MTARQREYKAMVGDEVTLSCSINQNGTLQKVIWEKYDKKKRKLLDTSLSKSKYSQPSQLTPVMRITDLKPSDAGTYQCLATNEYGTGKSEALCVNVLCK